MTAPGFRWDAAVDFAQIWLDYRRTEERMTMRDAVTLWLALPEPAQRCVSIRPSEPYTVDHNGREVTIGILSFQEIEALSRRSDFQITSDAKAPQPPHGS